MSGRDPVRAATPTTRSKVERADIRAAETLGRHRHDPAVRALGSASEIADQLPALAACGAVLAAGLALRRPRVAEAGARMLASVLVATALKSVVKTFVSRARPHMLLDQGRYAFEPLGPDGGDWHSFPSGHTADAVATARGLARVFPQARVAAYIAAGAIGAVQIPRAKHYPLDVAAGAAVGVAAEAIVDRAAAALLEALRKRAGAAPRATAEPPGGAGIAPHGSPGAASSIARGGTLAKQTIAVLGGGNALGAYLAGAYERMHELEVRPDWIVGASAGAITGAIVAGNPPERRLERLREFWAAATLDTVFAPFAHEKLRQYYNGWHVAWSAMFGRPGIFTHRLPGFWGALPGTPNDVALYDHSPLRATLERLVDFDRLNRSDIRLTVCCVDIETGEEVVFDTTRDRIGPEHVLASTAITPGFPPVMIEGRMLCDPGYVNNTPLDLAFATPPDRETLCVVVELFSLRSPRPASLDAVLERTQDIMFASPTRRTIAALRREYALRAELDPSLPPISLLHLAYQAAGHELAAKTLDFSPSSIADRWAAGMSDMSTALAMVPEGGTGPGLTYLSADPEQGRVSAEAGRSSAAAPGADRSTA